MVSTILVGLGTYVGLRREMDRAFRSWSSAKLSCDWGDAGGHVVPGPGGNQDDHDF